MASPKTLRAALAASLVCLATPARAEFPGAAFYLGVFGGGNLVLRDWDFGGNAHLEGYRNLPNPTVDQRSAPALTGQSGGLLGARIGLQLHQQLALEGELGWWPVSSTAGGRNDGLVWDVGVLVHVLRRNWTPTIAVGVGGVHNLGGDLGPDGDPRFHVGLGVRGRVHRLLAVRAEVRDVITDGFDGIGGNNIELLVGAEVLAWQGSWFGDKDRDGIVDPDDACPDVAGQAALKGCPDGDGDGVPDKDDKCPKDVGGAKLGGCPDRDGDGVIDGDDRCPDAPAGASPDRERPGCPTGAPTPAVAAPPVTDARGDRDLDGVADDKDACPELAAGSSPDGARPGCPADRDQDGVADASDGCIDVPAGASPDRNRPGCPADRDGDGVPDDKDGCPDVAVGQRADDKRAGCPADGDGDGVPDAVDACADKAGAPDPDARKNGCPGLVRIAGDRIVLVEPVLFVGDREAIQPRSLPVLAAVAAAIAALPPDRRIVIEGHSDDRGKPAHGYDLSQRRAAAVKWWLEQKGVAPSRMEAKGLGPSRPLVPNRNDKMRAINQRVEVHLVPPAGSPAAR